jgi:hypothetical protein
MTVLAKASGNLTDRTTYRASRSLFETSVVGILPEPLQSELRCECRESRNQVIVLARTSSTLAISGASSLRVYNWSSELVASCETEASL